MLSLTAEGKALLPGIRKAWRQMDVLIEDAIGAEKTQLLGDLTAELKFALGGRIPGVSVASQENQSTVEVKLNRKK